MAILHFKLHGPRLGVSAVERYEYLVADLPHFSRGKVECVDSGNLPKFAEGSARDFWCAADGYERINGRVFTEIEAALPNELTAIQNEALAGEAVQDLLGGSFPYTIAIHSLLDADNRLQSHMHIMFCERPVTPATSILPLEQFFKRNGAKKDKGWNSRTKPYQLRVRWCHLLNGALTRAGLAVQLSPEKKLDGPIEPKVVGPSGHVNYEAARQVKAFRKGRRDIASLVEECEREADMKIAAIEANLIEELLKLDKLAATL
jgi:hypothetical protein